MKCQPRLDANLAAGSGAKARRALDEAQRHSPTLDPSILTALRVSLARGVGMGVDDREVPSCQPTMTISGRT